MPFMAECLAFFPTRTKQMGMGSSLIRRACHSQESLETPIDLREIAIQQMIEGTARARLGRTLRTKSLALGEAANYQINEEVGYYRPPINRDTPGWTGPDRIVDFTQIQRETFGINHQGRSMTCKLGALRRHLTFLCFESAMLSTTEHSLGIVPTAKALVESLVDGSVIHFGLVKLNKPDGSTYWHTSNCRRESSWQRLCLTPAACSPMSQHP